ncbi:MAG: hypothetical protein EZS28_056133 [Streblomastix strix]|uniref:Uncharacterized protein n=1 Tax=Streblomastix strix TaxID=222440 RepID=A0A5J4PPH1_9EUKA|nr:MAG: hypothetical protein EZS28_056133 [Streblomastix strix]
MMCQPSISLSIASDVNYLLDKIHLNNYSSLSTRAALRIILPVEGVFSLFASALLASIRLRFFSHSHTSLLAPLGQATKVAMANSEPLLQLELFLGSLYQQLLVSLGLWGADMVLLLSTGVIDNPILLPNCPIQVL